MPVPPEVMKTCVSFIWRNKRFKTVPWCGFHVFPQSGCHFRCSALIPLRDGFRWQQRVGISTVHSRPGLMDFLCVPVGCSTINRRVAQVLPFTNLEADNEGKESRLCHSAPVTPAPVPNGCCWFNWLETGPLKQNRVRPSRWECYTDTTRRYNWPLVYSDTADVTFPEHFK